MSAYNTLNTKSTTTYKGSRNQTLSKNLEMKTINPEKFRDTSFNVTVKKNNMLKTVMIEDQSKILVKSNHNQNQNTRFFTSSVNCKNSITKKPNVIYLI